jgi:hypothetical protein
MGMIGNSLAQGLISGANIQDGTVDTPDIKDSAVTAAKIASAVVTPAKMDFSAGTANGVLYLNGSKVASSGSALVFDGTNVGIGTASPARKLSILGGTSDNVPLRVTSGTGSSDCFIDLKDPNTTADYKVRVGSVGDNLALFAGGSERVRIDSNGNVGVGLTGLVTGWGLIPKLQAKQTSASWAGGVVSFSSANDNAIAMGYDSTNTRGVLATSYASTGAYSPLAFDVGGAERFRISTGGNVGINNNSPSVLLHVTGSTSAPHFRAGTSTVFTDWGTDGSGTWFENTGTSTATRAIRVQAHDGSGSNYAVIKVDGGNQNITFSNYSIECARIERTGMTGGWGRIMTLTHTYPVQVFNSNNIRWAGIGYDNTVTRGLIFWTNATDSNVSSTGSAQMTMGGGQVNINGALSKGSGSFRIEHPLPALAETHELVHSFIEGPQADNIYRGKVTLVNGAATVNIDTASSMTDGTFVLLNREVQCFTTNETGWVHVRGSVTGNVLTIEAQDSTCTDTISWMVIGERQDKHMYDTSWTDENGKVIVEPLKEIRPEPQAEEGAPE